MSRFHMHLAVEDLDRNIGFYTALFGVPPTVEKPDYAKWELADPAVNFAISARGRRPGLDHVGIQAADEAELAALRARLEAAGVEGIEQSGTTCCYARSDKYWSVDPQGIAWEGFHTLGEAAIFGAAREPGSGEAACCTPDLPGGAA